MFREIKLNKLVAIKLRPNQIASLIDAVQAVVTVVHVASPLAHRITHLCTRNNRKEKQNEMH